MHDLIAVEFSMKPTFTCTNHNQGAWSNQLLKRNWKCTYTMCLLSTMIQPHQQRSHYLSRLKLSCATPNHAVATTVRWNVTLYIDCSSALQIRTHANEDYRDCGGYDCCHILYRTYNAARWLHARALAGSNISRWVRLPSRTNAAPVPVERDNSPMINR